MAMKVFGGPLGEVGKYRVPKEDYENALRYALSLEGIASACLGVTTAEELEAVIKIMETFSPLTEEEFLKLSMKGLSILQKDENWRNAYGVPEV